MSSNDSFEAGDLLFSCIPDCVAIARAPFFFRRIRSKPPREGDRHDHQGGVGESARLVLPRREGRGRQSHHLGFLHERAWAVDAERPTKDMLKLGALITVEGFRAKDGSNNANSQRITLPDQQTVVTGTQGEPTGDKTGGKNQAQPSN